MVSACLNGIVLFLVYCLKTKKQGFYSIIVSWVKGFVSYVFSKFSLAVVKISFVLAVFINLKIIHAIKSKEILSVTLLMS